MDDHALRLVNNENIIKEKVDELTEQMRSAGYKILSGPRTTGDGYYESCIVVIEGNLIEITEWKKIIKHNEDNV